jgi:hypothetical protein
MLGRADARCMQALQTALVNLRPEDWTFLGRGAVFALGLGAGALLIASLAGLGRISPDGASRLGFPATVASTLILVLASAVALSQWRLDDEALTAAAFALAMLGTLGITQHHLATRDGTLTGRSTVGRIGSERSEKRAAA